jgi:hypothetical protein
MKHLYTTLIGAFVLGTSMAQLSIGSGYQLALPLGQMKTNINPTHSMTVAGLYQLRNNMQQLSLGLEFGLGSYAQKNMEQTFTFSNGNQTVTNVNYSSNMWQAAALVRYDLLKRSNITPYVSSKVGYNRLYANIRIDDPRDADGCHPLDRKSLLGDGTMTASAGLGVKLDMAAFSRSWDRGQGWFDLNVNYTTGGTVSYINTRKLSSATTASSEGAQPLNLQFINVNTQNIHQHQVAEVFTSPLRMLQVQLCFYKAF